ncbi:MAG TPA: hypothetical protein ENJ56_03495, partial [Anaerolineae bacterium]|nr:hypothetical protein [Anaerolineae bacterium]
VKAALKALNIDDKKYQPRNILSKISDAKDKLITPQEYPSSDYLTTIIKRVYEQYQATLIANNALDFDDLLFVTVKLFVDVPHVLAKYQEQYHHFLVDEFQDTNTVQYQLVTRLAEARKSIFVVGDSDQSIYKWRGADYRNIGKFREAYPDLTQILLEQNYRSTQTILDAAKAVIKHNPNRVHKDLFTERTGGAKIVIREAYNEQEEATQIVGQITKGVAEGRKLGDYAIMYRTNAQSRVLEDAFVRGGMPYRIVGAQRFYGRREIKDMIAYLRLIHNLRDEVSFRRVVNVPTRGVGKKTLADLLDWGASLGLQGGEAVIALATQPTITHPFKGRALSALTRFGNLLNGWTMARESLPVADLLDKVLEQINFKQHLDDGTDEGRDRWQNVMEFRGVANAGEGVTLVEFLEQVALVADADTVEETANAPTLLTLHASKGLEFPVVFIAGIEEKILPHSRSLEDGDQMAEERRLFYVGLTRAKDKLYLSYAFRRSLYGMSDTAVPSRFLGEIPSEVVLGGNSLVGRHAATVGRASEWSWDNGGRAYGASGTTQKRGGGVGSRGSQGAYGGARGSRHRPSRASQRSSGLPAPKKKAMPKKNLPPAREAAQQAARRKMAENRPKATQQYKSGQTVRHAKFGEGMVIESKLVGNDEEVTVAFSEVGIKRLAASFAKLDIV